MRARDAAEACLGTAILTQGLPETIPLEKSGSNTAAIQHYPKTHKPVSVIRPSQYLHNIVGQDPRAVTRLTPPLLGFKSCGAARGPSAGLAVRHAIRKGQEMTPGPALQLPAEQGYAWAAEEHHVRLPLLFS